MLRAKAGRDPPVTTKKKRKRHVTNNNNNNNNDAVDTESFAVVLLTIVITSVVLLLVIPRPSTTSPQRAAFSTTLATNTIRQTSAFDVSDDACEDYGCPVYPTEWDENHDKVAKLRISARMDILPPEEWSMATLTRKSTRKGLYNQDAGVVIRPFRTKQTNSDKDFFIGIFDGHGSQGHHVSFYAAGRVPEIVARKFNDFDGIMTEADIVQALHDTILETDIMAPPPAAMLGGTTASVTLRRHNKLYMVNTGDSRTIIVRVKEDKKTIEIPFLTSKHKPDQPEEKARIEAMDGLVKHGRVWVYSTAARETIGLAMSRSIGDWEWGAAGVIAEPAITVLDVNNITANNDKDSSNTFILAASDGMWDARTRPEFFANQFLPSFGRQEHHPLVSCYDIIDKISPKNKSLYRDDITMIAMKLL